MCAAKSEEIDVARYADTTPVKAGYLMQVGGFLAVETDRVILASKWTHAQMMLV